MSKSGEMQPHDMSDLLRQANWPADSLEEIANALDSALPSCTESEWADLGTVVRSLAYVADPPMGARNMARFLAAVPHHGEELRLLAENVEHRHFLSSLFSFSQLLSDMIIAEPDRFDWLLLRGNLWKESDLDVYRGQLAEVAGEKHGDELLRALHWFRDRELLRIGLRDVQELADEAALCRELSALAQAIIEAITVDARRELLGRHGVPRESSGSAAEFCVFALGKLGSNELNFSSDVDLVFVYSADGQTEGARDPEGRVVRQITSHEFFNRVAGRISERIGQNLDGKFLYRVDARLRPDGTAGALARSLVSYVNYFQSQGRVFEQVAYLRARAVAGDAGLAARMNDIFIHFAFDETRRTDLVREIGDLKRRIDFEALSDSARELDIKRGRGGIREIEFLISLHQLAHGASDRRLRQKGTIDTLELLGDLGHLALVDVEQLRTAYYFFRRIEHTLQMMHGEQTHLLPDSPGERGALALRCGWAREEEFETLLESRRARVNEMFCSTFNYDPDKMDRFTLVECLRMDIPPTGDAHQQLVDAGLDDREGVDALRSLVRSRSFTGSLESMRKIEQLLPVILEEMPNTPSAARSLRHFAQLLHRIVALNTTLDFFIASPRIFRILLDVLGFGDLPARSLISHPEWMEYLFSGIGVTAGRRSALVVREEVGRLSDRLSPQERMGKLRVLREREVLLITVREIGGILPSAEAAKRTALLAEVILQSACDIVAPHHSRHMDWPGRWCILALGGFGAGEAHALGDLDIVFVYDGSERDSQFLLFARDLLTMMSQSTQDGVLWRLDVRLRPDGTSGPLVTSRESMLNYYAKPAQTWEWLAFLKARPVAGDIDWGYELIDEVFAKWESRPADRAMLLADLGAMRKRTVAAVKLTRRAAFDLKRGPGGLWDVDFLVGAGVLLSRRLIQGDGEYLPRALDHLKREGLLGPAELEFIQSHSNLLKSIQRGLRLLNESTTDHIPSSPAERAMLGRALKDQLGSRIDFFDGLETQLRRMRALYSKWFG